MKTILAPVDFSSATQAVVTQAAALAKSMGGQVQLFAVTQPPILIAEYGALMENIAEITDISEKAATKHLAKLRDQLTRKGIPAEAAQETGSPVALIVEQARKAKAAYIVMGSHGHTAFFDLLVGSTTHGVLRRAPCPVVIVPPVAPPKAKGRK